MAADADGHTGAGGRQRKQLSARLRRVSVSVFCLGFELMLTWISKIGQ